MTGLARGPQPEGTSIRASATGGGAWNDLRVRIASGCVLIAAALGITVVGGWPFNLFWLAAGLAVLWEWQGLLGAVRRFGAFTIGALGVTGTAVLAGERPAFAVLVLGAGAAAVAWYAVPGKRLASAGGVIYAGALVCAVCLLRASFPNGMEAILWLFAVVWGTDSMAFFGGRLIRGPKLWARVSPSKTWSGFLVGIVSGSLLGWAVSPASSCAPCMLGLGLVAGALAQAGDLFESALKRRSGVKDASGLIPGHGGVMDRLDGFIAASVFAACLGAWRFGPAAAGAGLFNW